MTGRSHHLVALGFGLAGLASMSHWQSATAGFLLFAGILAGGRAPDHLEGEFLGDRIIPHRTLTHWFPFWLAALVVFAFLTRISLFAWLPLGYAVGGLLHIACDALTPMGVPVLTPWRRKSMRLVSSAAGEFVVVALSLGLGVGTWSFMPRLAHADGFLVGSPQNSALLSMKLEGIDKTKRCQGANECGWWWGFDDNTPKPAKKNPAPKVSVQAKPSKAELCQHTKTWDKSCGFVDPKGDFALQAKERDALRIDAVMNPGDQHAVLQFQKYMRWASNEAVLFTQMWQYNQQQFPSLNPQAEAPVSRFGLLMASAASDRQTRSIWGALQAQKAFFVYFTRSDCEFCHAMAPTVKRVSHDTGLPVWDASLDSKCLPGFKNCHTGDTSLMPARILRVSIVPTLFVYLPSTNSWIRVSTGISSVQEIEQRTHQFFTAVRAAAARGLKNGVKGTAPVDFSGQTVTSKQMLDLAAKKGLAVGIHANDLAASAP